MAQRSDEVKRILGEVLDLPAAERPARVAERCGDRADLRREVESLLSAFEADADRFLAEAESAPGPVMARPGDRLGGYRLLERTGVGGFGEVWRGRQASPARDVAIKVIRNEMVSRQVAARFEAERQTLALMDHPNIARVFDGGETDDGRPFLVMEFVSGCSLTAYCQEHALELSERLEVFLPVCRAVQHAHTKGVIHRDLKPNNVLVASGDEGPVPKVIDFGIAKALHTPLVPGTVLTDVRQIVGTPEYMAPEQADAGAVDVDTRADVYALGVLLYEVVAGSNPFASLRERGLLEMLRAIREEEPEKPSTRVSASALANGAPARTRSHSAVRGELDWIVMKCLAKERGERYQSAAELAEDIERYLAGEPVLAGPPSGLYRVRKFARKHAVPLTAAVLLLGGLTASAVVAWNGWVYAREQANAAEDAAEREAVMRRDAQQRAREARDQADRAGIAVDWFMDIVALVEPGDADAEAQSMPALLERFATRLEARDAVDPYERGIAHEMLAHGYVSLRRPREASEHAERALELLAGLGRASDRQLVNLTPLANLGPRPGIGRAGPDVQRRLEAITDLVRRTRDELPSGALSVLAHSIQFAAGAGLDGRVHRAMRDGVGLLAKRGADVEPLRRAQFCAVAARVAMALGEPDRARELLAGMPASSGDLRDAGETFVWRSIRSIQAKMLFLLGDPATAEATLRETLERAGDEELPGGEYGLGSVRHRLGCVLLAQKRWDEAERVLVDCMETVRAFPGERYLEPEVRRALGIVVAHDGRNAQALAHFLRSAELQESAGNLGPELVRSIVWAARCLSQLGRFDEARTQVERALELREQHPEAMRDASSDTLFMLWTIRAQLEGLAGRYVASSQAARRALALLDGATPPRPGAASVARVKLLCATSLRREGDLEAALALYREAVTEVPEGVRLTDRRWTSALFDVSVLALALGEYEQAYEYGKRYADAVSEDIKAVSTPNGQDAIRSGWQDMARARLLVGQYQESLAIARRIERSYERVPPADRRFRWMHAPVLGGSLAGVGDFDAAAPYLERGLSLLEPRTPEARLVLRAVALRLASILEEAGRAEQAATWRAEAAKHFDALAASHPELLVDRR